MAGSYTHVMNGWSMIENMGDAHECVEELLWLVQREIGTERASELLDKHFYPMARGELRFDDAMTLVKEKMKA